VQKTQIHPNFFHNLNYDSHLFIKNLNSAGSGYADCIPNTEEKYISFSKSIYNNKKKFKYRIQFIDSFKFMSRSRDKLVNNLKLNQFKA